MPFNMAQYAQYAQKHSSNYPELLLSRKKHLLSQWEQLLSQVLSGWTAWGLWIILLLKKKKDGPHLKGETLLFNRK